jgi:uncharacterized membrane protein
MGSPVSRVSLRNYTSISFEILIIALTILPFFVLAYFYSALPERVPLFLNLSGEVVEWSEKSWLSVFRVPLLAVVTQVFCLLVKYGAVESGNASLTNVGDDYARLQEQFVLLNVRLWDWFRLLVAFKLSASSLNTIFLSIERFKVFSSTAFAITFIAALLSIVPALFYCYRLIKVQREMKQRFGDIKKPIDMRRVYGRFLYFNPADSALFVSKYIFNFANKWAWVFIACIIAYPLLVFA